MASPPTGAARAPGSRPIAYARIAGLTGLFLLYVLPHLASKALRGRSPWPRRFLRAATHICGVKAEVDGHPLQPHTLLIANHTSWLDILILGGTTGCAFVSKAEVRQTALIGWLADQNRTLYIDRAERGDAQGQVRRIAGALDHPQPLAVFPEGTTGTGRRLLAFRSTLLDAVAPPPPRALVRPAAIDFGHAVDDIAWHGGERGLNNVMRVLGRVRRTRVTVRLLDPLPPHDNRKALTRAARRAIGEALSSVEDKEAL